ncbi:hypothetical protein HGRIS_012907 [Hohenbuehelia grisea]|uniref:Palmitoyltransferase n=1 Tax=Hohenbuehelia grisea TaxID=104357 RepID=A0ABR3ITV0_9AGAR
MSTPSHSLNKGTSPPATVSKRLSGAAQLPLPSTLTGVAPSINANTSTNRHSNSFSTRPGSPRSPLAFHRPTLDSTPLTLMSPTHHPTHPVHTSSTHAGGVLPSASFFRPSRPDQQQRYSQPDSLYTASHEAHNITPEADVFPLGSLTKRHSTSSSDGAAASVTGGLEPPPDQNTAPGQFSSLKRMKQSREPLLPIGGRVSAFTPRKSTSEEPTGQAYVQNVLSRPSTTGNRVRNSLERVFSLRRGMSFESIRKSTSSRPAGSTLEGKLVDEEHGVFPSRHKQSSSPVHMSHSLHVSDTYPASSSPDPSFFPNHPKQNPPLADTPVADVSTGKVVRKFQRHPSRNRFFLGGRLLTGGDSPWAFVASFSVVLSISGVWLGTTCVYWWQHESPALAAVGLYVVLIIISTMLTSATTDPGILPRNLDPDPPYPATSPSDGGVRVPMPRDLKVRSDVVRVKYCVTCKTYRPPRSSHCKVCDNCIDNCDHHCQWINNCVGRRNYTTFFALLLTSTLALVLVIVTSALHIYWLTQREGLDFRHALTKGAGSAVAFCLSIVVIWPVGALLSYHLKVCIS